MKYAITTKTISGNRNLKNIDVKISEITQENTIIIILSNSIILYIDDSNI